MLIVDVLGRHTESLRGDDEMAVRGGLKSGFFEGDGSLHSDELESPVLVGDMKMLLKLVKSADES